MTKFIKISRDNKGIIIIINPYNAILIGLMSIAILDYLSKII